MDSPARNSTTSSCAASTLRSCSSRNWKSGTSASRAASGCMGGYFRAFRAESTELMYLIRRIASQPMIPAELLLEGYRRGVFPMGLANGEIGWFSPDPRAIIPIDAFHVPHGLERVLRKCLFE